MSARSKAMALHRSRAPGDQLQPVRETPRYRGRTRRGTTAFRARSALERAEKYLRASCSSGTKHDVPSRNLSGGMKRRLMIARAMVNEPKSADPRRAHGRRGHRNPALHVGADPWHQRGRYDGDSHHPLPRRGRGAVSQHRHHRSRRDSSRTRTMKSLLAKARRGNLRARPARTPGSEPPRCADMDITNGVTRTPSRCHTAPGRSRSMRCSPSSTAGGST